MSKLLIPNTTQTPNVYLDVVMPRIKNASLRVMLAVVRKTYGFGKQADAISITQLQKLTGLSRQGVVNGIAGLGPLVNIEMGSDGINVYSLNLDISTGELVNVVDWSSYLTSQVTGSGGSQRSRHTKPNIRTKPNRRAPKNQSTPDPKVKTLIDAFAEKYLARVGKPYVVAGGKDGSLLKIILSAGHDVGSIEAAMDTYFADPYHSRNGFDIGRFKSAFNSLNSAGTRKRHNYEEGTFPDL